MLSLFLSCIASKQPTPAVQEPAPEAQIQISIPKVGEAKPYKPPVASKTKLENGSELLFIPKRELPLVLLSIHIPGGYLSDPMQEWGRTALVADMIQKSSGEYTTAQRSQKLRLLAAHIDVSIKENHTLIQLSVHKDRLEEALPFVSDMLFLPSFTTEEWDQLLSYKQEELKQSYEDAGYVANTMKYLLLYPEGSMRHRIPSGTPNSIQNIKKESALDWHYSRLLGSKVGIVATGDIDLETLKSTIAAHFPKWPAEEWEEPSTKEQPETNKGIFLIDMPQEQQSNIHLLSPAWSTLDSNDALIAQTSNIAMGGSSHRDSTTK